MLKLKDYFGDLKIKEHEIVWKKPSEKLPIAIGLLVASLLAMAFGHRELSSILANLDMLYCITVIL